MPIMKNVYRWIFSLLSLFLLFSCTTVDTVQKQEAEQDSPVSKQPVSDSTEKKPVWLTVEMDEYFPLKETVSYQDGYVDSYRLYDYDEKGHLLKMSRLNREETTVFEEVYSYNSDGLLEKSESFSDGKAVSSSEFVYNGGRQLIEERYYSPEGKLMAVSSYEYNEKGQRIKWTSGNSGGIPIMYTLYSYEGERLLQMDYYMPNDKLEAYTRMEYQDGVLSAEATYSAEGRLEKKTVYMLKDGKPAGVQYYKGKNLLRSVKYERNKEGYIAKEINLNRNGTVVDIISREFIVFTVEKTVLKED